MSPPIALPRGVEYGQEGRVANHTDDIDESDGQDSPVLKNLRKQVKEQERELETLRKQARGQAEAQLEAAGFPGMIDLYVEKGAGAPVTEWLTGLGLTAKAESSQQPTEKDDKSNKVNELAETSSLSQELAGSGGGGQQVTFEQEIGQAKSQADLAAIAAKHKLRG